jgi:ATP-binding cassette subfamily B protein
MAKFITNKTLLFYWYHVSKYPRYLIGVFINVPLTVFVYQFLPPLIVANVLNRLSEHDYQPHHLWASFGSSLIEYAILVLLGGVVMWRITDLFDWKLEAGVERDIARRVFNHLLSLSANFHANTFSGALVSKTNKLMGSYIRFADTTVFQVIPLCASLVFTLLILSKRAPVFVSILLLFSIFYIISALFISRAVRRLSAIQANAESTQTGYLSDAIINVMAIKSFAGGMFEKLRFEKVTNNTRSRTIDVMHGSRYQLIYLTSITNTISAVALVMAVVGVMVFKSNLATVFLILTYTATIAGQLFSFGTSSLRNYNRAFGDAHDMVEILAIEPEVKDPVNPERNRIKYGEIKFENVVFTHDGAGDTLFRNLNVEVRPGQKVGLVGHSGSGKTTFMRLLLRFSDIDGGEILIDGQNIAHITQDDLRRSIAYVPQEPIMFHRTLLENIEYGLQDATKDQVIQAAKRAHAHDFIELLPEGYNTLVGERGVKLSGGQRQRIAIARAMLKDAPILVLDEATSSLDSDSEALIQDTLWKLMEGRTAIVIAHRLSTIQKMDRIIVLEDGEIVEDGKHKDLLASGGIYAKLWAHQSGGFLDE